MLLNLALNLENAANVGKRWTSPENKMSTQSRNEDVSPFGSSPERIKKMSYVLSAGIPTRTDREVVAIAATIYTNDKWKVNLNAWRPGPSSLKQWTPPMSQWPMKMTNVRWTQSM